VVVYAFMIHDPFHASDQKYAGISTYLEARYLRESRVWPEMWPHDVATVVAIWPRCGSSVAARRVEGGRDCGGDVGHDQQNHHGGGASGGHERGRDHFGPDLP
jgi:hypothetical protein